MVVGKVCFFVQLWWEVLPWMLQIEPGPGCNSTEVRDDEEGSPRAMVRVGLWWKTCLRQQVW